MPPAKSISIQVNDTQHVSALLQVPPDGVRGLAFLGFPLHPAKQPSDSRAAHLLKIEVPMLFLQGARDELAHLPLVTPLIERLGARAKLSLFADADHSFHVPVRSGR